MEELKPFAEEETVIERGKLTIENRLNRIAMYGSLDLTKDKEGLEMAKDLQTLLGDIVECLAKLDAVGDLPGHVKPVSRPLKNRSFERV